MCLRAKSWKKYGAWKLPLYVNFTRFPRKQANLSISDVNMLQTGNIGKTYKVRILLVCTIHEITAIFSTLKPGAHLVETLTNRRGTAGLQHATFNYVQGYANN